MSEAKLQQWDTIIERRNSHAIKWDAMENFIGKADLKPFWVADMDFKSPPEVIEALENRAKHGVFGYTYEDPEAIETFGTWVARRHKLKISSDWVMRSPGVVTGIGLAIQAFTKPGDGVVIQPPVYAPFSEMTLANERRLILNPIEIVDDYAQMNLVHLEQLFKEEQPKMMIFCNPHNPLGRVWDQETVQKLVALCIAYEVFLFSDEIHSDLLFKNINFHSAMSVLGGDSQWVMSAMAPSKTFNIAGLSYSLLIIPNEERRKTLKKVMDQLHLSVVNCFNEGAAKVAYSSGEAWLDSLMPYLEENYRCLCEFVAKKMPEVRICKMEGTYLAWLDFRAWYENGHALKQFMIHEAGVALSDGRAFGAEGKGFVRFNFGCPRAVMLDGLESILAARGN